MTDEQMLFATEDQQLELQETAVAETNTEKYLIFVSDGLRYGLNAEQVAEIITNYSITPLPRVPNYVRGIVNLRGQIIPIVDIRLRLGKPPQEGGCFIVVEVDNASIGILVDGVEKMEEIPVDIILPTPTQNDQKMISGMCSLPEGGTMLILDCELLLHG